MRSLFSKGVFWAGLLLVLADTPHVLAQSDGLQPLLDRLDRLERDIRTLNIQLSRDGKPLSAASGGSVARLEVRLTELEGELRAATGKAEEVAFQLERINQRLDKLIGDVDYRLSALEGGRTAPPTPAGLPRLSAAPSPPSVQTVTPGQEAGFAAPPGTLGAITESDLNATQKPGEETAQPAPQQAGLPQTAQATQAARGVLPEGSTRERYTYALGLLRQANYDEAEVALREFLAKHGDDPLANNARYWLGETFYVREDFRTAAQIFIDSYKKAPKSAKAPDTLLKLGMSLAKLDKKNEACSAFDKLSKDFPKAPPNITKLVAKERKNNGCE